MKIFYSREYIVIMRVPRIHYVLILVCTVIFQGQLMMILQPDV